MWLRTEELGDIPDVTAADIDEILPSDAFGKFLILSASEDTFIQAGSDWQPTPECAAFLRERKSDPWVLEYRDGTTGRQYAATRYVTLDEVRNAFVSYLAGDEAWRSMFSWKELEL
jgi:hypothetical protein